MKVGGGCKKIIEYGMGFGHETVMIEDEEPELIEIEKNE